MLLRGRLGEEKGTKKNKRSRKQKEKKKKEKSNKQKKEAQLCMHAVLIATTSM